MAFEQRFKFLVCAPAFDPADLEGQRIGEIVSEVQRDGFTVVRARDAEDAKLVIRTDVAIGCVLIDWTPAGEPSEAQDLIDVIRKRGLEVPIFLLVRHHRVEDIPVDVIYEADGYVFLAEETPDFIAKNLASRLRQYAATLRTPFFGALLDYAEEGNQLWTCPGHNGGSFYARSPIGRIFREHLGEAVFRDDIDNSVVELGDLLIHEGPALAAQREAARIFGAERTYFVLNGTSASNKIVLQALIAEGDLVLFDRNNHKAAHHGALFLGGGVPVYLPTDRNAHGLIGPIDPDSLCEESIRAAIRNNPLVTDPHAWQRPRPFRAAVIELCTYDGTILDAQDIVRRIGHLCEYIVFDEAWAGFMKFHPIYGSRYAMGVTGLGPESPGIIATQSTHKQLASFSQASQIHVRDEHLGKQARRVEHRRLNEMFLMHASTSPFYPLFASLDVGAQMMKGRSGMVLWDDTIRLGIEIRKKLRATAREFRQRESDPARQWFFEPFVPDSVELSLYGEAPKRWAWEDVPTDILASDPSLWELGVGARWHGFGHVAPGYAMTDPNKLTLLTPGFDNEGRYLEHGIPAPILAVYLRENRIVPEKNDLNSLLFLLTPGVESSKAGNLLSALVFFKRLHDDNVPMEEAMPEFTAKRARRYRGVGLRDLCAQMHALFRDAGTSALQIAQFRREHLPGVAMPTQRAVQALVRNEVDFVPIGEAMGRIATTLWVVYPPGIAAVVPGERLDERARPMVDYLLTFEQAANQFPGFETEVQGLYREVDAAGGIRFHTYVVRE